MGLTGIGSGVMLALAAGLWLVYLVPSWLRSREYSATERNAIRLQQTLRILAETTETPTAVRAESTARGVLEQAKIVKLQERQRAAAQKAVVAATKAAARAEAKAAVRPAASAARRLKRTRLVTSLVVLAAIVVLAIQIPLAFISGLSSSAFAAVLFAGIALVSGFALLSRLREIARSRAAKPAVAQAPVARRTTTSRERPADVAPATTGWTPVPVPKPIYLSRDEVVAPTVTAAAVAAELARAARESELAVRAAQEAPEVTPIRQAPTVPAAPPSPFASMGRLNDADLGRTDIDEVLERRRAAG